MTLWPTLGITFLFQKKKTPMSKFFILQVILWGSCLKNAQEYIKGLEKFIETKVASISTSPEREDTILIENPFSI